MELPEIQHDSTYDFCKTNHDRTHIIVSVDADGNTRKYNTLYYAGKLLGINSGYISLLCTKYIHKKYTAYSKITMKEYSFHYETDDDVDVPLEQRIKKTTKDYHKNWVADHKELAKAYQKKWLAKKKLEKQKLAEKI